MQCVTNVLCSIVDPCSTSDEVFVIRFAPLHYGLVQLLSRNMGRIQFIYGHLQCLSTICDWIIFTYFQHLCDTCNKVRGGLLHQYGVRCTCVCILRQHNISNRSIFLLNHQWQAIVIGTILEGILCKYKADIFLHQFKIIFVRKSSCTTSPNKSRLDGLWAADPFHIGHEIGKKAGLPTQSLDGNKQLWQHR